MDGTGWRNATYGECLPSAGAAVIEDVTERPDTAGLPETPRSRTRRALLRFRGLVRGTTGGQPATILCLRTSISVPEAVIGIEIGGGTTSPYLLLPHRLKVRLLSPTSRAKLDHQPDV
jgi:hypothetical protein